MHMSKLSHGRNPDCGVFIRIITQSFLLILCGAYAGRNTTVEGCPTIITWEPIHYYIKISTDIFKNESAFRGQVGIDGVVLQDTNELFLHSKLYITKAFYTIEDQRYGIDWGLAIETRYGGFMLNLNQTLMKDQHFRLTLEYNGKMNTKPGIYMSYYNSTKGLRPVVSTELPPMGARFVFPCLDEPRFKAKFSIEVARPQSMVALSNMELIKTSPPDRNVDNQVWDSFHPTPTMSTYLVSIVICDDYQNVSLSRNSFYWFPRESKDAVNFLASEKPNLFLKSLETFTGINYTLPKLDHIVIPGNQENVAAMENWGLITWKYEFIKNGSEPQRLRTQNGWLYDVTLVHEIIHQWFGNLVTCRYWCYIWLNEGLTTFLTYHILNQLFPLTKLNYLFSLENVNPVMAADLSWPIYLVNKEECCRNELFGWSQSAYKKYLKGAAITQMVEGNILSNGTFRNAIQRYLEINMYGTVTNKELWGPFQEVIEASSIGTLPEGTTLETVMDTWAYNGGFPVVHLHRFENGSVAVRQEEFLTYVKHKSNVYWWIPLTYTTSSKNDFSSTRVQKWLSPNGDLKILETNISDKEWIIFNIQQKGYYKVNYDLKTWEIITDHLMNGNFEDIHPMNRAWLLRDAFIFAKRGLTKYSVALNLSKYLVRENDFFPLKVGNEVLLDLLDMSRGTPLYKKFMNYCRFVFNGIYQNVRLGRFKATDLPSSWLRTLVIHHSCECNLPGCKEEGVRAALLIINQKIQEDQIDPLLRNELWCYGVELGGWTVFDYVKDRYINETDDMVKSTLLSSLFCADKEIPSLVEESLLQKGLFKNESTANLWDIIFHKPSVVCHTVTYINDHYATVLSSIGRALLRDGLSRLDIAILDKECKSKSIKIFSKFDILMYAGKYPMKSNLQRHLNSWLDAQNLTIEEYSEESNISKTVPNMFLRQDELDIYKLE